MKLLYILAALIVSTSGSAQSVQEMLDSEVPNRSFVRTLSDPGIPQIVYNNATQIRVYNWHVLLNGFRFMGGYSRTSDLTKSFPVSSSGYTIYDHQYAREGFGSQTTTNGQYFWTALFAVAKPSDPVARILFVPYSKVSSWSSSTATATIQTLGGTMSGNFSGNEALVITEQGNWSGKILNVASNTSNTVTFKQGLQGVTLASGDYFLLSPGVSGSGYEFKYLRTIGIDYLGSGAGYNWRNFQFLGDRTYSYTGGYGTDITQAYTSGSPLEITIGANDLVSLCCPRSIDRGSA